MLTATIALIQSAIFDQFECGVDSSYPAARTLLVRYDRSSSNVDRLNLVDAGPKRGGGGAHARMDACPQACTDDDPVISLKGCVSRRKLIVKIMGIVEPMVPVVSRGVNCIKLASSSSESYHDVEVVGCSSPPPSSSATSEACTRHKISVRVQFDSSQL
jgi:hypothetical protein